MNLFKHTPCVNCHTTSRQDFNLKKSKNICRACLKTIKYSPLSREYTHGLIDQMIFNRYWKTTNNNGINYGQPYSQIHLQQTR